MAYSYERLTSVRVVLGSNPRGSDFFFLLKIACLSLFK